MDTGATDLFRHALVDVALEQHRQLGALRRGDPILRDAIAGYCADLGVRMTDSPDTYHYSAVFISWCMRQAGASEAEFPTAVAHCTYAYQAASQQGGFIVARPIVSFSIRPGDLVHMNRGKRIAFADLSRGGGPYPSESGIVTAVEAAGRRAEMIVGNWPPSTGTVTMETAALTPGGEIVQRTIDPFICILVVRQ